MDNNLHDQQPLVSPAPQKSKFYWPTRILLLLVSLSILAAIMIELAPVPVVCAEVLIKSMLYGYFTVRSSLMYLLSSLVPVLRSPLPLLLLWSLLFLVFAGKSKRNPRYSRWMGLALLMFAGQLAFSKLPNIIYCFVYGLPIVWTNYLPSVGSIALMVFCLFLAILFFTGMKKKLWVFIAALIGIILWFVIAGIDTAIYMIGAAPVLLRNLLYMLEQLERILMNFGSTPLLPYILYLVEQLLAPLPVVADYLGTTCFWVGLMILIFPAKKKAS